MQDLSWFCGEHILQKLLASQFYGFLKRLIKIAAVNDGSPSKERLPDMGERSFICAGGEFSFRIDLDIDPILSAKIVKRAAAIQPGDFILRPLIPAVFRDSDPLFHLRVCHFYEILHS